MMTREEAITRTEEVIKFLKDQGWDVFHQTSLDILALKMALSALTQPNEWVSVENDFPPEHDPVLCIVSGKPKPNITLEDAYQLGSWNKADGWTIDEWPDWEGSNVTWWMKLPEPPDHRPPEGEETQNV